MRVAALALRVHLACCGLVLFACEEANDSADQGSAPADCTPGEAGCPPCTGPDCVPETCPPGSLGCRCYGNATCDNSAEGQPMVCQGTTCAVWEQNPETCPPGDLGCKCLPNGTCSQDSAAALSCQGEVCAFLEAACPTGDIDCPCYANATCNFDDDGELLQCQGQVCVSPSKMEQACPTGQLGCPCYPNASCGQTASGASLECVETTCQMPTVAPGECQTGTLGCPCFGNASCYAGPQGQPLVCEGTTCVIPEVTVGCVQGDLDCECYPNATCNIHSDGEPLVCVDALCARTAEDCAVGTLDCPCTPAGGCGQGLQCLGVVCVESPEQPQECPTGTLWCACGPSGACGPGLTCQGTVCVETAAPCPTGTLSCPCFGNGTCGPGPEGQALECAGTTCQVAPTGPGNCPFGTLGCPCQSNGACGVTSDGKALACVGVTCELAGDTTPCTPGELYCGCTNGGECDSGLVCGATNVCIVPTCLPGDLGCGCLAASGPAACTVDGNFCDSDSTCQSEFCVRGEAGCGCTPDGSCAAGLACQLGVCAFLEDLGPVPPENPKCFSPCSSGKLQDGAWVPCESGLMAGCLTGQLCFEGSCIAQPVEGVQPVKPACGDDTQCPDFQACIAGGCYSNCDVDSQCNSGHVCRAHTCKKACTTTGGECPAGSICDSSDGATGVCVVQPTIAPPASGPDLSPYRFELGANALAFDQMLTDTQVALFNYGPTPVKYVVTKLQHSFYDSEGLSVIDTNPLGWLHIGPFPDGAQKVQSFELVVAASDGDEPGIGQIKIAEVHASSLISWDGILEIEGFVQGQSIGKRRLRLVFRGEPDGVWTGNIVYFANFRDTGLSGWVNGPDGNYGTADDRYATDPVGGLAKVQQIQNAFVKRWIALKDGDISIDEFAALLQQTVDGSWNWNNVKSVCPNEADPDYGQGCYLYDDPNVDTDSGVVSYSASLEADPIPSGASAIPVALHLKASSADPGHWAGRIESPVAMHYPGNPAFSIDFASDPKGCDNANQANACLAYLDGLTGAIVAGGRYETTTGTCPDGEGFNIHTSPWLLDDFVPAWVTNSGLAQECVYTQLPYGADQVLISSNKSMAGAFPVPSGRAMTRNLRLVDGAMINQREMVILFEETVSNPYSSAFNDRIRTYGVMILERGAQVSGPGAFEGADQAAFAPNPALEPVGKLGPTCTPEVLSRIAEAIPGLSPEERQAVETDSYQLDKDLLKQVALASVAGTAVMSGDVGSFCVNGECDTPSNANWTAHYFCEDTGLINGGPDPLSPVPCPHGSNVVYFATRGNLAGMGERLQDLPCQANELQSHVQFQPHSPVVDFEFSEAWCLSQGSDICENNAQDAANGAVDLGTFISLDPGSAAARGTCAEQLQEWQSALPDGIDQINFNVAYNCYDPTPSTFELGSTVCDGDRYDLLNGKVFIQVPPELPKLKGLSEAIQHAFRYKTKFTNRDGTSLPFSPETCQFGIEKGEYCYDPEAIDLIRQRVDCATHLYTDYFDQMAPVADTTRATVRAYLQNAFGKQVVSPGSIQYSFERLYADLLLTKGDDGYTAAFAGRFDLAGEASETFEGAKFEVGGIDLTGGPGYEMFNLYQAVQYYDLALDRFHHLAPKMLKAVRDPNIMALTWVSPDTVVRYVERIVRASAQKAAAVSEIGKRYHAFYQHDLARRVVERGYHSTYVESMLITGLMQAVLEAFKADAAYSASAAQLRVLLENTQLKYTQALLRMRDLRADLDLEVTYFGYPPEYIPFPGLTEGSAFNATNAVAELLATARERALTAAAKENAAIAKDKAFATDQAALEQELLELRANYQNRLQELCGTFEGDDGNVYPATNFFADLSALTRETKSAQGDICGFMGNGEISLRKADLEGSEIQIRRVQVSQDNVISRVNSERQRVSEYCGELLEYSDFKIETGSKSVQLSQQIEGYKVTAQVTMDKLDFQGELQAMKAACGKLCAVCESTADLTLWIAERHPDWLVRGPQNCAQCASAGIPCPGPVGLGLCDPTGMIQAKISCPLECAPDVLKCGYKQAKAQLTLPKLYKKVVNAVNVDINVTGPDVETVLAEMAKEKTGDFQAMKVAEMGWETKNECDMAVVDSNATTKRLVLDLAQLELDALSAAQSRELIVGDIDGMYREVRDIQAELQEAEQATLNLAAAKNDPSMRIRKNSAIVTADRTFERALRAAYKLTRVFEYYTSQSYAYLGDLFLVRMVQYGPNTLEQYLDELEDAFAEFEELYGKPDLRVSVLSLKDDIFRVPRTVGDLSCGSESTPSNTCTVQNRSERFRAQLLSPRFIDENGHIVIPFSTDTDALSPLTRNHKIYSVEVELSGTDLGDNTARVYLRQVGVSTVEALSGGDDRYYLPERTGVVDVWLNGQKPLGDDVYTSWRFRERPYANSQWELVINTVDEPANEDLNLEALRDIKLYIYYTDFTVL